MEKNIEIEFKCLINEVLYNQLLQEFNLENNIYVQTNHYFDTDNLSLKANKTILRIRKKPNTTKITAKSDAGGNHAFETHLFINNEEADKMIKEGFDASVINLEGFVTKKCELTTYRVKTPYKEGTLFIDKNVYYDHVDYELEYEADDYEEGENDFYNFLEEYNIPYTQTTKKSIKAFEACKCY